jgi:predicted enzyme related to lactoylglutathione lyase
MSARTRPVSHLELHTADGPRAAAFYAALCGWRPEKIEAGGRSYLAMSMGRRAIGGGIVEGDVERSMWLPYVAVSDVARATERARGLDAAVLLEPREGPAGWRSIVATPAGGAIAFWQPKR